MRTTLLFIYVLVFSTTLGICGEKKPEKIPAKYFAHEVREDKHGVIAPWCDTPNGACDYRVRVSAETLKRYPWADANKSIVAAPEYVFFSQWRIDGDGKISLPEPFKHKGGQLAKKLADQWLNGDLGSRYYWIVSAMTRYYAYCGDPMALGSVKLYSDYILDHGLTPKDHPWPEFPVSCPTAGKYYGKSDPEGFIQTDYAAEMCRQMLFANYDVLETGVVADCLSGEVYVAKSWFKTRS